MTLFAEMWSYGDDAHVENPELTLMIKIFLKILGFLNCGVTVAMNKQVIRCHHKDDNNVHVC